MLDEGFTFGRGAFETLPILARPVWLERHMERLNRSLVQIGLDRSVEVGTIAELIDREQLCHTALKIIATAENLVLMPRPMPSVDAKGVSLTVSTRPHPANPPLAGLKTLNYLGHLMARDQALARGFSDAILLAPDGRVLETTTANLMVLIDGVFWTPVANGELLPGIVRQFLLEQNLIRERDLMPAELKSAEVVVVTNSLIGIQPVRQLDDRLDQAVVDHLAVRRLQETYRAALAEYLL
jgi:branched-subunit amino acid aminotransferase/4-amino-4-deoxychorismate lyase